MLMLENVGKTYPNGVRALDSTSFTVKPGEIVAVIGGSGCGKSTLLRAISGLDRPTRGRVVLDGEPITSPHEKIGIVFQEPRLLPWRSVEQNVRLALPGRRDGADLDPLFEDLGLAAWRGRFPGDLSLGMARRVALMRALAVEPDLLVLDEAFVSLDERAASDLRDHVFRAVERRGITVLMVTHNLREALGVADRLILLTPRPASVLGEILLDVPKSDRGEAWIEARRRELVERFAVDPS
jgi:ABC-type nitrate/sulfonate/bicarbonate transport system ATPase subunit